MVAPFRRIPTVQSLNSSELNAVFRWIDWNFTQYPTACAAMTADFRRIPTFPQYNLATLNTLFRWIDWNFAQIPGAGSSETSGGWPRQIPTIPEFSSRRVNDVLRWIDWNFRFMPDYCTPSGPPPPYEILGDPAYFSQLHLTYNLCHHRVIDRTSDGTIWLLQLSGPGSPPIPVTTALWYSDDDGQTWQIATVGADPSQGWNSSLMPLYIDEQDYAHVLWYEGGPTIHWRYSRGVPTGTGWAWSTPYDIPLGDGPISVGYGVDLVAFDVGGDVYVHWLQGHVGYNYYGILKVADIGGTPTTTVHQSKTNVSVTYIGHLDFDHEVTNPKMPTATPHIYISYSRPYDHLGFGYFRRMPYSIGPVWSTGVSEYIGRIGGEATEVLCDGTNAWFVGVGNPTIPLSDAVIVLQRDLANTTSTSHTPSGSLIDPIRAHHASMQSDGNIRVFAAAGAGTGAAWSGVPYENTFDTSAGTWSGWVALPTMGTGVFRDDYPDGGGGFVSELYPANTTPFYAALCWPNTHIFVTRVD